MIKTLLVWYIWYIWVVFSAAPRISIRSAWLIHVLYDRRCQDQNKLLLQCTVTYPWSFFFSSDWFRLKDFQFHQRWTNPTVFQVSGPEKLRCGCKFIMQVQIITHMSAEVPVSTIYLFFVYLCIFYLIWFELHRSADTNPRTNFILCTHVRIQIYPHLE